MMYWCEECKRAVDPDVIRDITWHSEVDTRCAEHTERLECPICGGEVEEAKRCGCGEWISEDDWACEQCKDIVLHYHKLSVRELYTNGWTESEALDGLFAGCDDMFHDYNQRIKAKR